MCQQMEVLKKIKEKGEVNGYAIELAEATSQDYVRMNQKVIKIEKDVTSIKKEQKKQGEMLARQGGQIDAIFQHIHSPIEEERKDAIFWRQVKAMAKTTTGKIVLLLMIGCIALSGQRILELIGLIK